jgi:hypothetical protein
LEKEDVSDSKDVITKKVADKNSYHLLKEMFDDLSGEHVGKSNRRLKLEDISDNELFASVLHVA